MHLIRLLISLKLILESEFRVVLSKAKREMDPKSIGIANTCTGSFGDNLANNESSQQQSQRGNTIRVAVLRISISLHSVTQKKCIVLLLRKATKNIRRANLYICETNAYTRTVLSGSNILYDRSI